MNRFSMKKQTMASVQKRSVARQLNGKYELSGKWEEFVDKYTETLNLSIVGGNDESK